MPSDYFAVLAQHSAWANRRLYQSCEALAPAEYLRERGSVYGSLHAALNHILATDRLWIGRIEGRSQPAIDEHQILYADLVALKVARLAEDEHLRLVISGLTTGALDVPVTIPIVMVTVSRPRCVLYWDICLIISPVAAARRWHSWRKLGRQLPHST